MDFKRYVKTFLFAFIFISCNSEYKKNLVKEISVNNDVVTIILDNTNKSKPIGTLNTLEIYYINDAHPEYENNNIILKEDISEYKDKFYDNCEYPFTITWFGGSLMIKTIYNNNFFEIISEEYINKI